MGTGPLDKGVGAGKPVGGGRGKTRGGRSERDVGKKRTSVRDDEGEWLTMSDTGAKDR